MGRMRIPFLLILLTLTATGLTALNPTIMKMYAATSPYIGVVPETTVDPALTQGMNYTVSIYTDYNGSDVYGYQFELAYNPQVLEGLEVVNGDLITEDVAPIMWDPGTFNNTSGILELTVCMFFKLGLPKPLTSGPGTLANVTFNVVGKGDSNLTLEAPGPFVTRLFGYTEGGSGVMYSIIDAETMPDHMRHGFFSNRFTHDVAVVSVTAHAKAVVGSIVSISVEVANIGKSDEDVEVAVSYDSTLIGFNDTVMLPAQSSTLVPFDWNITGLAQGTYTINATATIPEDGDPSDNWNTTTFLAVHDVAVVSVTAPAKAVVGSIVSISVEVANEGSFAEVGNVTILYDSTLIGFNDTVMLPAQSSTLVPFDWNTTGLTQGTYTINATATIPEDGDPSDNWNTTTIFLGEQDVAVVSVTAPAKAVVGSIVSISVEVANIGKSDEDVEVAVSYDSTLIDRQNVTLLVGEKNTFLFNWNTTGLAQGTYTINATATIPEDGDPSDNWNTTAILLAIHDVAVTYISVFPHTVYVGDLMIIGVRTRNQGLYNETFEVEVTYDTSTIEQPRSVALLSGATNYTEFSWNTTGVVPNSYTMTAKASLVTDQNLTNNLMTKSIVVNPPLTGAIAGTVMRASDGHPIVGASVTAEGYNATNTDVYGHYNITGVPVGTFNVTVEATGYFSDFRLVTVESEKTTIVNFTLQVSSARVHDVAVTSITINPMTAKVGENVTITVVVKNQGTERETFTVTVYRDATEIETKEVTDLDPDAERTLTFVWDTTGLDAGGYTMKALTSEIPGETDEADNTKTYGTFTLSPPSAAWPPIEIIIAGVAAAIVILAIGSYVIMMRRRRRRKQ